MDAIESLFHHSSSITSKALAYKPLSTTLDKGQDIPMNRIDPGYVQTEAHPFQLQQELLDEMVRIQQETMLLKRIYMAHAASIQTERHVLQTEAIMAKTSQVEIATALTRELEMKRARNSILEQRCKEQRVKNREIYRMVMSQVPEKSSSPIDERKEDSETERFKKHNALLRSVLVDLIAAGGIDWNGNARIRKCLAEQDMQ